MTEGALASLVPIMKRMNTDVLEELLPDASRRVLEDLRFSCFGAAQTDTVLRLKGERMMGRTNPVTMVTYSTGGAACNIARTLARLGADASIHCAPPGSMVTKDLRSIGVRQENVGSTLNEGGYTAVLETDGELAMGLANMDAYDEMDAEALPDSFPGSYPKHGKGVAVFDANFNQPFLEAAARKAINKQWEMYAVGTSAAKVGRLGNINWNLVSLNIEEARQLSGQGNPVDQAIEISKRIDGAVAVTCGPKGAYFRYEGATYYQSVPPVKPVNVNGAGDAFSAALSLGFALNMKPETTLRLAVATGALHATGKTSKRHQFRGSLKSMSKQLEPCKRI